MLTTNAFAEIGSLVGDPARASMVVALMDGRALTATELSAIAGVTPQTASSHLNQLVAAGLLAMERQGRHRYHRLATPTIARMVEGIMTVASETTVSGTPAVRTGPRDQAMRHARTCYDHLAGRVAVAIADAMIARGEIVFFADVGKLTSKGGAFFDKIGIDPSASSARGRGKRVFCRPCLDWSERRVHIAGVVGTALLGLMTDRNWLTRVVGSRAVTITPAGRRNLDALFDLGPSAWE
ncbi:MAG: helix-turn-helix transcriptional regulator [Burkholderiaceae bacterium]|nr:helix-turn-helix transcriptional regulator [Burkholderiaceae bacterium]